MTDLLACLEEVLEDPGLALLRQGRRPHPAVQLYDHISEYIRNRRFPFEDESESVASIITLLLDQLTWAAPGRMATVLEQIEDPKARQYVARAAREASKFDDVVAELTFWGWLRRAGFNANMLEEAGLADIIVDAPVQFWAEVKRISTDDNPRRARDVIKKANRQLKKSSPDGPGVLFLHLRRSSPTPMVDGTPPDIQPFVDEAMRELGAQQSRSVSHVLVMWDDASFHDNREDFYVHYAARRQCVVLSHKYPRGELPVDPEKLRIGTTILLTVAYPFRKMLSVGSLSDVTVVADAPSTAVFVEPIFTDNEFPEGVRRDRAAEVLRDPDFLSTYAFGDVRVLLATRLVAATRASYVTLIVASQIGGDTASISSAFKLFGSEAELGEIKIDPLKAFIRLVDRYGVAIGLCGFQGEFFPSVIAEIPEGEEVPIISAPQEKPLVVYVLGQRVDSGPPHIIRFVWVFAVRTDDYRRAVRSRRP
ncbi:hypothetical protein I4I73_17450 [Pseudonocardia sp. KRD-184]|uniref:Uncharacterized protein n=1 Tax=Pseudonocardia oceani TaxID=2792013 RepID=A0ABS6U8N2_9PSEU|nr:hypothetical protein [Pseudonocardia oceani]MBW0090647.1 hypothetical protein [Pseudonocardia oceani]MBW0097767.1 hypothetical protein [Pseudonocardia oceani]MBW0108579.1 hypothetical protein [Pseudonocardia oceani]MBW0122317.1 hypothetical protein [Pseudonocardia oceani]MBW0128595.1 hypothetical protein [Pseudonocardia oceani]